MKNIGIYAVVFIEKGAKMSGFFVFFVSQASWADKKISDKIDPVKFI